MKLTNTQMPVDDSLVLPSVSKPRELLEKAGQWTLYAIMAFPIVDFGLRLSPIHPLGVVWDKIALLVLLLLSVIRFSSGYRPQWFLWHKLGLLYVLFGLCMVFAGLSHVAIAVDGFRFDVYYLFFAYLIPFVIRPDDFELLLHIGAATAILIAIHGIYQYVVKAPMPANWVGPMEHVRTRVYSVFESPNEMAAYLILMTPTITGLALYTADKFRKWMYGGGAVVCLIALFLTGTRGAWIALVAASLVTALLVDWRLLVLLVIVCAVAYFLPPIHHRIDTLFSTKYFIQASKAGRIQKWLTAWQLMMKNPLFGTGLGTYGGAVASDFHLSTYSDNYYAKLLGESGIVGLVLFLSMQVSLVLAAFKQTFRIARGERSTESTRVAVVNDDARIHTLNRPGQTEEDQAEVTPRKPLSAALYVAATGPKRDRRQFSFRGNPSAFIMIGISTGLLAILFNNVTENIFEVASNTASYYMYASLLLVIALGSKAALVKERGDATSPAPVALESRRRRKKLDGLVTMHYITPPEHQSQPK